MDGLFHGKSNWNGWFGGTSHFRKHRVKPPNSGFCPLNNICFAYVYFIYIHMCHGENIHIISYNGNGHLHLPIFIEIYRDCYGAMLLFQDVSTTTGLLQGPRVHLRRSHGWGAVSFAQAYFCDAWQRAFLVLNINHVGRVFSYRSFWKKHIRFPHQIVSLPQGICQNWVWNEVSRGSSITLSLVTLEVPVNQWQSFRCASFQSTEASSSHGDGSTLSYCRKKRMYYAIAI